jgi:hypothetical protein
MTRGERLDTGLLARFRHAACRRHLLETLLFVNGADTPSFAGQGTSIALPPVKRRVFMTQKNYATPRREPICTIPPPKGLHAGKSVLPFVCAFGHPVSTCFRLKHFWRPKRETVKMPNESDTF